MVWEKRERPSLAIHLFVFFWIFCCTGNWVQDPVNTRWVLCPLCIRLSFLFLWFGFVYIYILEGKSLTVFCRTGVNKFCGFNKQVIKRDCAGNLASTTWLLLLGRLGRGVKPDSCLDFWENGGIVAGDSVQREAELGLWTRWSSILRICSVRLSETFWRNLQCLPLWNSNPRDGRLLKVRHGPELRDDGWGCRKAELPRGNPRSQEHSGLVFACSGWTQADAQSSTVQSIHLPLAMCSHLCLHR